MSATRPPFVGDALHLPVPPFVCDVLHLPVPRAPPGAALHRTQVKTQRYDSLSRKHCFAAHAAADARQLSKAQATRSSRSAPLTQAQYCGSRSM